VPIYLECMGYSVEVPAGATIVGRDPACALRLDDEGISRRHLCLVRRGDEISVEDLGSSNGTALNGEPLAGTAQLRDRDVLELGSYRLVLRIVDEHEDQTSTRREASLAELGSIKKSRTPASGTRVTRTTVAPKPGETKRSPRKR
jgi:pSer/pThr/pTyr-binding forkhead associated (FHA) protein